MRISIVDAVIDTMENEVIPNDPIRLMMHEPTAISARLHGAQPWLNVRTALR